MDGIFHRQGADFMQVDNAVADLGFPMSLFDLQACRPAIALHAGNRPRRIPERFPVSEGLKNLVAKGKKQLLVHG